MAVPLLLKKRGFLATVLYALLLGLSSCEEEYELGIQSEHIAQEENEEIKREMSELSIIVPNSGTSNSSLIEKSCTEVEEKTLESTNLDNNCTEFEEITLKTRSNTHLAWGEDTSFYDDYDNLHEERRFTHGTGTVVAEATEDLNNDSGYFTPPQVSDASDELEVFS